MREWKEGVWNGLTFFFPFTAGVYVCPGTDSDNSL
jgi:hypothetical protein